MTTFIARDAIDEKIKFYNTYNFFKNKFDFSSDIASSQLKAFSNIKNNKKEIINATNFMFINSVENFSIISNYDSHSPFIIVNESDIKNNFTRKSLEFENISNFRIYYIIFAIVILQFGLSLRVNIFENSKTQTLLDLDADIKQLAHSLYHSHKNHFNIFYQSKDENINKVFSMGKKYIFSLLLALDNKNISYKNFKDLIELDDKICSFFIENYTNLAKLSLKKENFYENKIF